LAVYKKKKGLLFSWLREEGLIIWRFIRRKRAYYLAGYEKKGLLFGGL
jgi:hypothetical protein